MTSLSLVKAVGDAVVLSYERTFDRLEITLRLWDERPATLVADGVGLLEDSGTWECDGVVRMQSEEPAGSVRFGIVNTESIPTLVFCAASLVLVDADGRQERLAP